MYAAPVFIDIERPDSPQSIAVDHSQLELSIGERVPIGVYGTYSDGSIVRLTNSIETKYEPASAGVVSVVAYGLVIAVAPGSTTIVVRHRERQAIVRVNVIRDRR